MSTISFIMVVLVALIAGMASVCDERQFHRPIVACTLMGWRWATSKPASSWADP